MILSIFIVFLRILFLTNAQTDNPSLTITEYLPEDGQPIYNNSLSQYKHPYLIVIRNDIVEENVPTLLNELTLGNIYCTPNHLVDCFNISLQDVINQVNLTDYSTEEIAEALTNLGVNLTNISHLINEFNITWTTFGEAIHSVGVTVNDIYNSFIAKLTNPNQKIPLILDIVEINRIDFSSVFLFGTEPEKIDLLSTGTYDQERVIEVLEVANLTSAELLSIFPLKQILITLADQGVNNKRILSIAKAIGLRSNNLNNFYQSLNITTNDLLSTPFFSQQIEKVIKIVNKEEVIGTAISQNQVITSKRAIETFSPSSIHFVDGSIEQYFTFQGHLVENDTEIVPLSPVVTYPEILTKEVVFYGLEYPLPRFANVSLDYNASVWTNCIYLSKTGNGDLYEEQVEVALGKNYLLVQKSNTTTYVLGSPVFCNNKVHGLATDYEESVVKFTPMLPNVVEPPSTPYQSSAEILSGNICLGILTLVLMKYVATII